MDDDPPPPVGLPVVLDLTGTACLVVGGGPVAARKAAALARAGASVTVVTPVTGPGLDPPPAGVRVVRRAYAPDEAAGYRLVVAATGDPEVDGRVVADARSAGAWVNSAGGAPGGTVELAATVRAGPVTVAVSTGGTSPAVAAWVRDRVAEALPPGTATVAGLAADARRRRRADGRPTATADWARALDRAADLVAAGRVEEARRVLDGLVDDAGGADAPTDAPEGPGPAGPGG